MSFNFFMYSVKDLLRMIDNDEGYGHDFAYNTLWSEVFKRWGLGLDLEPLIELLQSEKSAERSRGAWYLDEADPPPDFLADVMLKLIDDPMSHCRWRCVAYLRNSGLYNDALAKRLVDCLLDTDLYVRTRTIVWAAGTNDERFAHFAEVVDATAGAKSSKYFSAKRAAFWRESQRKRAARGIEIAKRLRAGKPVASIRAEISDEDSFTFDLLASMTRTM
jgi:hypothetical protein